jgi:hypothetical protein
MRAITRHLRKVPFYRETQTDLGRLLSRTETADGWPVIRANTPKPEALAGDGVPRMAFLVDDSMEEDLFL